jgi:hypothetical protein
VYSRHLDDRRWLGWEIRLEFRKIQQFFRFRTPFELQNFHQNFIFPIVKCVPADSEHVPSGSESSAAINFSNFMNWKTLPLYMSVASGIKF